MSHSSQPLLNLSKYKSAEDKEIYFEDLHFSVSQIVHALFYRLCMQALLCCLKLFIELDIYWYLLRLIYIYTHTLFLNTWDIKCRHPTMSLAHFEPLYMLRKKLNPVSRLRRILIYIELNLILEIFHNKCLNCLKSVISKLI